MPRRVALRDGRRQRAAHAGQHGPHLPSLSMEGRPVARVHRRRLVAVGEKHERRLARQYPRERKTRVVRLRDLAVAAPRQGRVDQADRLHDFGPVGADLDGRVQQHGAMRREHRGPDRGATRQRRDHADRRALCEFQPRPRPAVHLHVLDLHALRDVECQHDADAGERARRLAIPAGMGQGGDRDRQQEGPGSSAHWRRAAGPRAAARRAHGNPIEVPRIVVGARSLLSGAAWITSAASGSSSGSRRTARSRL